MGRGFIVVLLTLVLLVVGLLLGCGPTKGTAVWHNEQAFELNNHGRYDEAIEECTKAIELDPSLASAYSNRAEAYKLQGNSAEAIADLEKFITLTDNPKDIEWAR